jgi:hypothetical protein
LAWRLDEAFLHRYGVLRFLLVTSFQFCNPVEKENSSRTRTDLSSRVPSYTQLSQLRDKHVEAAVRDKKCVVVGCEEPPRSGG